VQAANKTFAKRVKQIAKNANVTAIKIQETTQTPPMEQM